MNLDLFFNLKKLGVGDDEAVSFAAPNAEHTDYGDSIVQGLKNVWYTATGQTEKTSAYQAQMAREDSAYQRLAQDMQAAGLSKFNIGSGSPQTGSYGSGAPQMLTMLGALADIKKVSAESRKTESEADYQDLVNSHYEEKHASDMAYALSQTDYNNARTELTRLTTPLEAEKIIAEVSQLVADAALSWSKQALNQVDLAWSDEEHRSSVESKDSSIQLNNARIAESREQVKLYAQKIAESVAYTNHLSEDAKRIVQDTAYKALAKEILAYDYEYSKQHGVRSTDAVSKILGLNLDAVRENSGLSKDSLWYKVLFTPFWNWFEKE